MNVEIHVLELSYTAVAAGFQKSTSRAQWRKVSWEAWAQALTYPDSQNNGGLLGTGSEESARGGGGSIPLILRGDITDVVSEKMYRNFA